MANPACNKMYQSSFKEFGKKLLNNIYEMQLILLKMEPQ